MIFNMIDIMELFIQVIDGLVYCNECWVLLLRWWRWWWWWM